MKTKKNFFKKLAAVTLGFVMTLGVGAAGYAASAGETHATDTTYYFTDKSWADSTNSWTSGKAGNGFTANQGVQITSGTSGANATTKNEISNITGIVIEYCTNSKAGKGTIKVQVGSNSEKTFTVTAPSSGGTTRKTTAFSYSPAQSGKVKLTVECGTNSIYIWSCKITYSAGPTKLDTPSPSFSNSDSEVTWANVDNASSYQVKVDDGSYTTATSPYDVSGLSRTTDHTVYVKAIGDGSNYSDSDAGSCQIPMIKTPQSLSVTGAKDEFYIGDYFSFGGTATVSYGASDPRTVTDLSFKIGSDYSSATAITTSTELTADHNDKNVYVVYTENGTSVYDSYSISVTAAPLSLNWNAKDWVEDNDCDVSSGSNIYPYLELEVTNDLKFTVPSGGNNGSFWAITGGYDWRIYQNQNGSLTISFSSSSGLNVNSVTVTYSVSNTGVLVDPDGNNLPTNTKYTLQTPANAVTFSVGNTNSGTTNGQVRITAISVEYSAGEVHYPVSVAASFATGKGSYYNGANANSKLNFSDVNGTFTLDNDETQDVITIDKIEIFEGSTVKGTLTSSSDKYDFKNADTSSSWSLKITCNGVTEGGGNLTSLALSITLINVEASSYVWKSDEDQPVTTFYSHFDTYNLGGTLYATYNDGSHATEGTSGHTRVDVIHEGTETGTVIESIPSHTDGTINVNENKTYWIESYFSQNTDEGEHLFTQVTVNMPTMTVVNGDAAGTKYYTNVPFEPNPNITVMKGSTQVTGLDADDFDVSLSVGGQPVSNPYTPTTTDTITVKVSLAKDSGVYGSYTVTPVVSTKTLTSLVISNKTYTAGDLFTFGAQDILVNYIENDVAGSEYITASSVTFTHSDETLDSSTRLLKNMNGWTINATYSIGEGEGKTVSTSFVITVSDKQISPYIPGTEADYFVKATSATELTSGKYLIVYESGNVALDGKLTADQVSNTISVTISNERIEKNTETLGAVVIYNSEDGSFLGTGGSYIGHSSSGNTLDYSDEPLANSVSVNSDGNVVIDAGSSYVMRYNDTDGQKRFRYYKGTQQAIQLYQLATTADVGNKIDYLKSIVDAIRLNQQNYTQEDLKTELRAHSEWTKASGILAALTPTEWNSLNVADAFGPSGSTYKSVYELALALSVSFNGTHVSSNGASSCAPGAAYNATLTVDQGYQLAKENISITMGGSSFSDFSYENGSLQIAAGKVTGDLAITATATVITYTITYNLNDGSVEIPNPISYNIETSATNLNPASKTGYQFLGWFTKDGTGDVWGDQVTQIGGGATGNLSLYARYQIKNHSITFVGSNVTSSEGASSSCNYGEEYTAVFTAAANYNLPGAIDVKLDGVAYADYNYSSVTGNFSIPSMPDGDITITVVAQQGAYQISYAEANGTPINQPGLVTEYESGTGAHLEPATKLGYTFLGWYTENTFVHQVTDIQIGETGNKLFYAKWEFNSEDLDAINTQVGMSYKYTKDSNPIVSEGASTSKAETRTAPEGYKFEKATSIAAGDRVVLVSETAGKEMTSISTTSTKYGVGSDYTSTSALAGSFIFTVEAGSETGSFAFKNGSDYLRWNSGNSLDTGASSIGASSSWSVSFDSDGNALLANAGTPAREIWWNVGNPRFACYTDKSAGKDYYSVQLYKLVPDKKEISSIAIVGDPTTTTYTVGQAYSTDGLSVQATYVDDTQGTISDATITINKATAAAGDTQIIYSCTYDGKKATDKTVNVTVNSVYSNGQFRFTFRPSGMDELVDTYLDAGYEDVGIVVSYNGKTRYFSYVDSYMYEGSTKTAYKLNEDGSFSLNLGDAIKNRSILDIEFTIKVYVKDANGYHTSSDSSAVVVSLSSWLQDHNKPAYQTDAFLELYHIFFPEA